MKWTTPVFFVLCMAVCGMLSCNSAPTFQKQVAIANAQWTYNNQPVFTVEVKDTAQNFDQYIVLRHDDAYPFSNLWLKINVKAPGDSLFREVTRTELLLADPSGKWLTNNHMSNIWEHKIKLPVRSSIQFKEAGIYQIKLEQVMRLNPLPSVLNIGIRLDQKF